MIERKSNLNTTSEEWDVFKDRVNALIENRTYHEFVSWHGTDNGMADHRMHNSLRFLPWHRAYLVKFERELRKGDSNVFIPYWDWGEDGGEMQGFEDFEGDAQRNSNRTTQDFMNILNRNGNFVNNLMQITEFKDFSETLEHQYHGPIHVWVGGTMNTARSPLDPAFWLHHAQVDRLWHLWQTAHQKKPAIKPEDRDYRLDPWADEFNIGNINDISQLNNDSYTYI